MDISSAYYPMGDVAISSVPPTPEMGDSSQLNIILKCETNISNVENLKLILSSNDIYGEIKYDGFLKKIDYSDVYDDIRGTNLEIQTSPEGNYKYGSIAIPLMSPEKKMLKITLENVTLFDDNNEKVNFLDLPIEYFINWTEPQPAEAALSSNTLEGQKPDKLIEAFKTIDKSEIYKDERANTLFLLKNNYYKDIEIVEINDSLNLNNSVIKIENDYSANAISKIVKSNSISCFLFNRFNISGKVKILPSSITYRVKDGSNELYSTWTDPTFIEINALNRPPKIEYLKATECEGNNSFIFNARFFDVDGSVDEFELNSNRDPELDSKKIYAKTYNYSSLKLFNSSYGERIITLRIRDNDGAWTEKQTVINVDEPYLRKAYVFFFNSTIIVFLLSSMLVMIQLILNRKRIYEWARRRKYAKSVTRIWYIYALRRFILWNNYLICQRANREWLNHLASISEAAIVIAIIFFLSTGIIKIYNIITANFILN
jgi:hypothetical protein